MRVLQRDIFEPFKLGDRSVPDYLYLRLMRYRLQVLVKDGFCCGSDDHAVAVGLGNRVEEAGEVVLGSRCEVLLAL